MYGEDCIIVLAAGLSSIGKLDKDTKSRINKTVELYKQRVSNKILICGGKVNRKVDVSIAQLMKKLIVKQGIPRKNILLEEKSLDTFGNALFSKKLIKKRGFKRLLLVTSDYHLERSLFIFHKVYGTDFLITGIDVPSGFLKKFILQKERKEQNYLLFSQTILTGLKKGDDKAILRRLQKLHPAFKKENFTQSWIMRLLTK